MEIDFGFGTGNGSEEKQRRKFAIITWKKFCTIIRHRQQQKKVFRQFPLKQNFVLQKEVVTKKIRKENGNRSGAGSDRYSFLPQFVFTPVQ